MKEELKKALEKTNVVGVIACNKGMRMAENHPDSANVYEWRVDCVQGGYIEKALPLLKRQIIVTVRDKNEGGQRPDLLNDDRAALYLRHIPLATFIDIEVSTASNNIHVIKAAKAQGVGVILSYHHFGGVPLFDAVEFERILELHQEFSGDILKVAVACESMRDLERLMTCVSYARECTKVRIAPMAMGKYGAVSRILFGMSGSPLVYGYLSKPQVPGQLHVTKIREM